MFFVSDDLLSTLSSLFVDESIVISFILVVTDGILHCSTNQSSLVSRNGGEYLVLFPMVCRVTLSTVRRLISLMI